MYAVVETGGRQFRVEPGQQIVIEKLGVEAGSEVTFDHLLMVVDDGGQALWGRPYVDGAKALGTVVTQERGPKILVFKYKPKVNYRRRRGHRQDLTRVLINAIEVS